MWRDQKTLGAIATNNFFLVTALLLQRAGVFIYLVLGLVLLFPMSADPLQKIPRDRLDLWPLSRRERWLLRILSPWVNPITWLVGAFVVWAARQVITYGLLAVFVAFVAAGFLSSFLPSGQKDMIWRLVPEFPTALGQIVRKNIRDIVSTLDFYCALILSIAGIIYRLVGKDVPADAFMALAILVVLALSSYAQSLFGFDGEAGFTRYHLLPVHGWQLLAAKDAAFLLIVVVLTLPLSPLAGLAGALAALAVGHQPSVEEQRPQTRWRFSTGANIGNGIVQVFLLVLSGVTAVRTTPLIVIPCAIACAASAWWYGREAQFKLRG